MTFQIKLRDYQAEAIKNLKNSYTDGYNAPLLVAPTGSGKTVIFSWITYHAALKNRKILILIHRKELLKQASSSLSTFGVTHGYITSGYQMKVANVQLATVQTLARRLNKIDFKPDLIIADEAHHSVASTWKKVFKFYPNSKKLFCTATPVRLDGKGIGVNVGGFADFIVNGPSVEKLIEQNFLTQPVVYVPPVGIDLKGINIRMGEFEKKELDNRINKPKIVGNVIEHYKKICYGKRGMAFCVNVKHAERVAEEFNLAGIPATSVDGTMTDSQRESKLNGLRDKKYWVLTSCELVNEGIDIPAVSVAILLRPTMSLVVFLQQIGRCLRPFPGKKETIILDHVGNCHRHGLPDDDRVWTLDGTSKKKQIKKETIARFRSCIKCFLLYPVSKNICPQCGTAYTLTREEIKIVEGELQKIEKIKTQQKNKKEVWNAKTLDSLIEIGKARGYKYPRGWAEKIISSREAKRQNYSMV